MFEEKFSECIKRNRKKTGLTQQQLADKLGISLMTVLRWEKGVRAPNSSILPKLAKELNISVDELMGIDSTSEKSEVKNLPINDENDTLEMTYWGGVVDKARKIAKLGNLEDISNVLQMLNIATLSLNKAQATAV